MNTYLEMLRDDFQKGKKIKYLFFWGHQPAKNGLVTASCFSQWWKSTFVLNGITFLTAEHWMMYQKAILFGDEEIAKQIVERTSSPGKAKKLGRQVQNFNPETWNKHKFELVVRGNQLKFEQHPDLKEFLMNTKNRVIVEASPRDRIWGIGMSKTHENIENPLLWRGQNLLGFALMEVRKRMLKA